MQLWVAPTLGWASTLIQLHRNTLATLATSTLKAQHVLTALVWCLMCIGSLRLKTMLMEADVQTFKKLGVVKRFTHKNSVTGQKRLGTAGRKS